MRVSPYRSHSIAHVLENRVGALPYLAASWLPSRDQYRLGVTSDADASLGAWTPAASRYLAARSSSASIAAQPAVTAACSMARVPLSVSAAAGTPRTSAITKRE